MKIERWLIGMEARLAGRRGYRSLCLLLLGAIACAAVLPALCRFSPWELANMENGVYMSARLQLLEALIAQLGSGNITPMSGNWHGAAYFLLQAELGHATGLSPAALFLLPQAFCCGLLLLLYPLMLYPLTKSVVLSGLSPWLLLLSAGRYLLLYKTDNYWAAAWVVLMALPLLMQLYGAAWGRRSVWLSIAIVGCIGVGIIPREQSSLTVLALLIVVLLIQLVRGMKSAERTPKEKLLFAATIVLILLAAIVVYQWGNALLTRLYEGLGGRLRLRFNESPWHTLYIGLGYRDNAYGIVYLDGNAFAFAQGIDPNVVIYTDEYYDILKTAYLSIVRSDAGYVLGCYTKKLLSSLVKTGLLWNNTLLRISVVLPVLFLCTAGSLLGGRKRHRSLVVSSIKEALPWLIAALLCMLIGVLPALVAMPRAIYLLGAYAGTTALSLALYICCGRYWRGRLLTNAEIADKAVDA